MPDEEILEQESEELEIEGAGEDIESEPEPEGDEAPPEKVAKPEHFVPAHELARERAERKALETRINQESQQNRVLKERLDIILSKIQEAERPAPEQPPNYDEDPAAYLKWQNDQILAKQQAEDERLAQESHKSQQERQFEQVRQTIKQGINQFAEATPDYNDAAKYLIEARVKELGVMGVTDQAAIRQRLEQDEVEVGYWAIQQGMSPGEVFYNLAKSRGYSGSSPGKDNSGSLDNVKRGQQAATSLSKGGGGATGEITTEALLAMSDDDFQKYTSGKKWQKLHGR